MNFFSLFRDFFGTEKTIPITQKQQSSLELHLAIQEFAIVAAINLIAGAISKCEFKTFSKGKEVIGKEYYLWNVEPNKNQNSTQFLQELVSKLLFYNECLIIEHNGELLIADSFTQTEYALIGNTFTNVIKGTYPFRKTFYMSDVLYLKYFNLDVKSLLCNLIQGYDNIMGMAIGKYKRAGGRKGILKTNKTGSGTKEERDKMDDLFNNRFRKYFENENAVLNLPNGLNYEEQNSEGNKKSASEVADIVALTKEIFERTAQAFKIPPAILRGDIADIGKLTDNLLTFCVDPLTDLIGEEVTRKRYGEKAYLEGSKLYVDTSCIKHIDIFTIAEAYDKLIASGGYSIDELRIKAGDIPLNTEWSKKHWITKNYTDVNDVKGGENIE